MHLVMLVVGQRTFAISHRGLLPRLKSVVRDAQASRPAAPFSRDELMRRKSLVGK